MTKDFGAVHVCVSLAKTNVCLKPQRKQSFLALSKENQSPLGLYKNPPTFFFTNPRFVLLIRDRRFVFVLAPRSSRITGACAMHTSYVIHRNGFHV